MLNFLNELLEIAGDQLNEDLGNLKNLGLGRMVNAFKQQFGYSYRKDLQTYSVGKKFSLWGQSPGQNSTTVEGKPIKDWKQFKRQYKAVDSAIAAIFSVDDKVCVLIVGSPARVTYTKQSVGMSWDFSGITCDVSELMNLLKPLEKTGDSSRRSYHKPNIYQHDLQSRHTIEKVRDEGIFVDHFEGVAQYSEQIPGFIDGLCKLFGERLKWKILEIDRSAIEKRIQRNRNSPIDRKDLKLFADDLSVRLAKYKNTKVKTVQDLKSFIESVFAGGLKKIKFAGMTYSAIPSEKYIGSTTKGSKYQTFTDTTMRDLLSGKTVAMQFSADQAAGEYGSLTLFVKFKNGQLVPVKAHYRDEDGNSITQDIE